jgi:AcrR family transcriptional regulator
MRGRPTGVYLASPMVQTPWGNSSELRDRKLRPGAGTPRPEVVRNQRERLFGAMVAVVAEKGYEATTVADLVRLSGVSRSDFYKHFGSKQDCFVAMVRELVDPAVEAILRAAEGADEQRVQDVFERFLTMTARHAATARVCIVELHTAGEEAEAVLDRIFEAVEELVREANERIPGREEMPPEVVRVLIGGVRKVIHTRLYRRQERELEKLAPQLWRWALSYPPPPQHLRVPRRTAGAPSQFGGYTPAERIARAVAAVTAEKGYQGLSTDEIAERASISLSTFYAHFADKRDAVLAAVEMGGAQMMASVVPAAGRATDWREGVRVAYEAMFSYLVAEPAFAQLIAVEVYAMGPEALALRDRVIDSMSAMLAPGFGENPEMPEIASEAIGGAIYALLRERLRSGGPRRLAEAVPLATYLTLAPFIGAEEAAAIANGGRGR